jgi:hypothetical protein
MADFREQRLTSVMIFVTVGLSVFMTPILSKVSYINPPPKKRKKQVQIVVFTEITNCVKLFIKGTGTRD